MVEEVKVVPPDRTIRIAICGPAYVGKTSFINRLINNTFYEEYYPTEDVDVFNFIYYVKAQKKFVKLEIHDTFPIDHLNISLPFGPDNKMPEQLEKIVRNKNVDLTKKKGEEEKVKDEKRIYDGYIFIYNMYQPDTLKVLTQMMTVQSDFEEAAMAGKLGVKPTPKVLIANKYDMRRKVLPGGPKKEDNKIDEEHKIVEFKCSSLTNMKVQEAFRYLVEKCSTIKYSQKAEAVSATPVKPGVGAAKKKGADDDDAQKKPTPKPKANNWFLGLSIFGAAPDKEAEEEEEEEECEVKGDEDSDSEKKENRNNMAMRGSVIEKMKQNAAGKTKTDTGDDENCIIF